MDPKPRTCLHRDDGGIHCMACGCTLVWLGGTLEENIRLFTTGSTVHLECPKCDRRYEACLLLDESKKRTKRSLVEYVPAG